MKQIYARIAIVVGLLVIASVLVFIGEKVKAPELTSFKNLKYQPVQIEHFEDNSNPGYEISGDYPVNTVGAAYVKEQVDEMLKEFKHDTDTSDLSPEDIADFGPTKDHPYTFSTEYSFYYNNKYLTHDEDIYTYTGGAHGGTIVHTYTYNLKGDLITFPLLLVNQDTALKAFSEKITEKLLGDDFKDLIMPGWLKDGAGPNVENFKAFAFQDDTLIVIFQQYQVAPYSAGILDVAIPLKELEGILRPEFIEQ